MNKILLICALIWMNACTSSDQSAQKKAALQRAANEKFNKVVQMLQADCDSTLQKETYKQVQLLLKSASKRRQGQGRKPS